VSDPLLLLLRLCLLALIYLTFFRVIRAVAVELRAEGRTAKVASTSPSTARPDRNQRATAAPSAQAPPVSAQAGGVSVAVREVTVTGPDGSSGPNVVVGTELVVGRADSCGLPIADPMVSKFHARLVVQDENCWLEDLGSTNGTLLNGHPLTQAQLVRPGDRVQVGEHTLELR
jgi:pSer/pThr/pTyr-binding forkhead associated (FHA) protein